MAEPIDTSGPAPDLRVAVEANPLWYHTLELGPELVTPGWFDLRPIVSVMPWPDVRGKRCLDVGTYDGFLAFELERRGASEVLALDISDHADWDWPAAIRAEGREVLATMAGAEKGVGFTIAARALSSAVQRVTGSVYDLSPEAVGSFDVVVCGSLMLHLRDPVRALEAIRAVCRGSFLSAETIDLGLSVRHARRPLAELKASRELHWWIPNAAGHRRMVHAAGFGIERATRPYCIPFGSAHPPPPRTSRELRAAACRRLLTGRHGIPHAAVLATPRV